MSPLCVLLALAAAGQHDPNYIVNGGFDHGVAGWTTEGPVRVETTPGLHGTSSVHLGPGHAAIHQRYSIPGLRIVEFGATVRLGAPDTKAVVRAQCYDAHHRLLMDLRQPVDPNKGILPAGAGTGLYFKTQAHTAYLRLSVESESPAPAEATVSHVELHDYDHDRVEHPPQIDLDAYMEPIWSTPTIVDETVLLLAKEGGPATGHLLFTPTQIISVTDSTKRILYTEGKDFTIHGRDIVSIPGSPMPTMHDYSFPKGDYPWLSVAGHHVLVTYRRQDSWLGPVAVPQAARLPVTVAKLRARQPVTIVAYGDSITLGINVSGYRQEPPYMPTWVDLFKHRLAKDYRDPHIQIYNTALGGMTAKWGVDNARDAVAALDPDLVLIAFGMNDFWSIEPGDFKAQIEAIMAAVRLRNPHAEFVLISSILFDPAYTPEAVYVGHLLAYAEALRGLAGPGVALLDMSQISKQLYEAKSAKDLLADPMHPDDFLARWYAQGMVQVLSGQ
jgi:lysophospholipase L1-like esterase